MLEFLVPSKVRRRLLLLLWGEKARGSVVELAERAGVAFASAHAELRAMQQAQLVRAAHDGRKEVFEANLAHPATEALRLLLAAERSSKRPPHDDRDDEIKRGLVALGAPLRGFRARPVPQHERVALLAEGVSLARRDSTVARCLPICVWNIRDELTPKELASAVTTPEEKHALGFFLELAAVLGEDRRLVGLAEGLRDGRMTSVRDFFQTGVKERIVREFPLAEKWGFRMNMDLESFQTLFNKFVKP